MQKDDDVYLLATDQLSSIFTVADMAGSVLQEVLYGSSGRRIQNSNPDHDLYLGFAAGLHDKDTGLIHFGYREYDPAIGRFITPDPIGLAGEDVDVYGYCLDDPINFVDRAGLAGKSEESKESVASKKGTHKSDSITGLDMREIRKKYGRKSAIKWRGEGRSLTDGPKYGNWGGGRYSGDVKKEQKQKIKKADEELVEDLEKLSDDSSEGDNPPEKNARNSAEIYKNGAEIIFKYFK